MLPFLSLMMTLTHHLLLMRTLLHVLRRSFLLHPLYVLFMRFAELQLMPERKERTADYYYQQVIQINLIPAATFLKHGHEPQIVYPKHRNSHRRHHTVHQITPPRQALTWTEEHY